MIPLWENIFLKILCKLTNKICAMVMWGVCLVTEGVRVEVKLAEVLVGESFFVVERMMVITQQL